ncbi:MAG: Maf family protein [Pyrinomonadaceae bacterium]
MFKLPKLILASGSPRRAEILTSVGWEFTRVVQDVDESVFPAEDPGDYVRRLARSKAESITANANGDWVLGADTIVVIDGQIIGKPADADDADRMLRMLSGNWHDVLTGVALAGRGATRVGLQKTAVKFTRMTDAEIGFLVEKGDPLDKAGAYAVQAQAALFIEGIQGDYWNVVGLPVKLVYELIK